MFSTTATINHPKLSRADPERICKFLFLYDQYFKVMLALEKQLGKRKMGTEAARSVDIQFFVYIEVLTSSIALDLITSVTSYEDLTEDVLQAHLGKEPSESRATVALSSLGSILKGELKSIDMKTSDASARTSKLFIIYHSLLHRTDFPWLPEINEKVAMQHVLSAIQPAMLRTRH